MLPKLVEAIKTHGLTGVLQILFFRAFPRAALSHRRLLAGVERKIGLEIGGPSAIFTRQGLLPIYCVASRIDNCNFGAQTVWEGDVVEGQTFRFHRRRAPGRQYVAEATDLSRIPSKHYDFLLSSHALEHVANPLRALGEWLRVLKNDGMLILVVPHRDGTFDHRRPVTSLDHLVDDFASDMGEDDLTHLPEILELHDLSRDPGAGDYLSFKARAVDNLNNRCLHHHVFDTDLAVAAMRRAGAKIIYSGAHHPHHIVVVGQKERIVGHEEAVPSPSQAQTEITHGPTQSNVVAQ